jgi:preprotein translocase subunit SecA
MEWLGRIFQKIFGSANDRLLKRLWPVVDRINALEPEFNVLTDEALRAKTGEYRARLEKGEALDDLLPEAFAAVREAARRAIGQRHYDVQLIGGIALHRGMIAEMVTGEGKTLVATLAAYLNALPGHGVHVVTVNDYLAKRDGEWMAPVFNMLGLSVGAIQSKMSSAERIVEYGCDITYGTNNEFGFDYLRDNMKVRLEDQAQGKLSFAIIDEVDSILIDEARTPLIISGPAEESTDKYAKADRVAKKLRPKPADLPEELPEGTPITWDFEINEKDHRVTLTERGQETVNRAWGEPIWQETEDGSVLEESELNPKNLDVPHYIEQSLRAHNLYKRDVDYVVKQGEVVIVDEFTGRLMDGRRWSDGLHQAVEAKERLRIKEENQTLATITFQNFFRLYDKISGMTGTALTEAAEFYKIYKLDVLVIPTNRRLIRSSEPDKIYRTAKEKYLAVIDEIVQVNGQGRPILVGTTSVEKSELLAGLLQRRGVGHEVLNAKHHEREAQIVAEAGLAGRVTIATNMAGRGTDITLGEGVREKGGLHIIGTERHEARRIDNQLRGRSGRQGDPGSSTFYLSLEDDLMRIFAREWVSGILQKLGMEEGQEIQSGMVSRMIERVQRKMETHNFEIRKNLLEYDQVMDEQRKLVYSRRQDILEGKELKRIMLEHLEDAVRDLADSYTTNLGPRSEWDLEGLRKLLRSRFRFELNGDIDDGEGDLGEAIYERIAKQYDEREAEVGSQDMRRLERFLLLNAYDTKWKDHLYAMDALKAGIGMRAYAQEDPKIKYKEEGYRMFAQMLELVREEAAGLIFNVQISHEAEEQLGDIWDAEEFVHEDFGGYEGHARQVEAGIEGSRAERPEPIRRDSPKVGRNDACPCGSGKKYKKCCGRQ